MKRRCLFMDDGDITHAGRRLCDRRASYASVREGGESEKVVSLGELSLA